MHARGRACTSPRDRGVIPPASSLDLLDRRVLRSDKSRDACHRFSRDSARTSADRVTLFRRFPPARAGRPSPGTRAGAASHRGGVPRARVLRSVRDLPEPVPAALEDVRSSRHAIQQLHSQKRAGNIRSQISHWANRPSKQRFAVLFFFSFFRLGLPDGRGLLLTKHAPKASLTFDIICFLLLLPPHSDRTPNAVSSTSTSVKTPIVTSRCLF